MAKVKVTKHVVIVPNQTSTVLYEEGFEGTAPHEHIEQIVAAGRGERIGDENDKAQGQNKKVAENQDAFKSGSDNVSIG